MKVCTDSCFFGAWVAAHATIPSPDARILDIGTGTGLLSLMLAQQWPGQFDAIEPDPSSASEAAINAANAPWAERIAVIPQSLQEYHPETGYDRIIVNPPFYHQDLTSPDARISQARHDDTLRLPYLLNRIRMLLKDNGEAYLLLPARRLEEASQGIRDEGLYLWEQVHVRPGEDKPLFRIIFRIGKTDRGAVPGSTYSIKDSTGRYTHDFIHLLRAYYLAFQK